MDDLTSGIVNFQQAALMSKVQFAVTRKMLDSQQMQGAAVIKLMENLSFESSRYGVKVFALHPGLIATGLGEQAIKMRAPAGSPADRAASWIRKEFAAGRCVSPERAADFLVAVASGAAIVSWVERISQRSEVRIRQVEANGVAGTAFTVSGATGVQSGAFPRIQRSGNDLFVVWTTSGDKPSVRTAVVNLQ